MRLTACNAAPHINRCAQCNLRSTLGLIPERELSVIANGSQIRRPLLEEAPRVSNGLIVDRRTKLGKKVIQHERSFQFADLGIQILGEVSPKRSYCACSGVG